MIYKLIYTEKVEQKPDDKFKNNCTRKQEYHYLGKNLEKQRTPLFYRLPKVHKIFDLFPSLWPITSGFNSCTCNLSKFVDFFLKYQTQKCKSYIRNNNDFLIKLSSIKYSRKRFSCYYGHFISLN